MIGVLTYRMRMVLRDQLQREAYVCKRAYELASTGFHIEPITVVSALIEEGYPEASEYLKVDSIRRDLHEICLRSWKGVKRSRRRTSS